MSNKKIKVEIAGIGTLIEAGLDAYARQNGWYAGIKDPDGNSISQIDFAVVFFRKHFRDVVGQFNSAQAGKAQEAVGLLSIAGYDPSVLDLITTTGSVEDVQ